MRLTSTLPTSTLAIFSFLSASLTLHTCSLNGVITPISVTFNFGSHDSASERRDLQMSTIARDSPWLYQEAFYMSKITVGSAAG